MKPNENIYPPSSSKIKTLKENGIFPFSYTSKIISTYVYITLSIFLFFPNDLDLLFPFGLEGDPTDLNSSIELSKTWFAISLKIILTFTFLTFLTSLYQSSFLFLPFRRYKDGNFKKNIGGNRSSNITIAIAALTITLLFLFVLYQQIIANISSSEITFTTFSNLPSYIYSIKTFMMFLNIFLFISTLGLVFKEKFDFYSNHKMSKSEIIQEIQENEGSNATKQQIRSNL